MPRDYRGRPRNIPSQNPERKVPYFPDRQADVEQFAKLRGPIPHGYAPGGAFVVSTYDSRPVNTFDFQKSIATSIGGGTRVKGDMSAEVNQNNPGLSASGTFTIPEGRTCVLRGWEIIISFVPGAATGIDPNFAPVLETGNSGILYNLDFLLNGSAIQDNSSMDIEEFPFGPVSGETFIIVPQNQLLTAEITRIPFNNGFEETWQIDRFALKFYGQLILSTGETPDFEVANMAAIPVDTKGLIPSHGTREGYIEP